MPLVETTDGTNWTPIWTKSGDQGNSWQQAVATAATDTLQVRLSGTVGGSYTSDMAIDDFVITMAVATATGSMVQQERDDGRWWRARGIYVLQ